MPTLLSLQCGGSGGALGRPCPPAAAGCSGRSPSLSLQRGRSGERMRRRRRAAGPAFGFAGPTQGGSFDDEDEVELSESTENSVRGLRLPGSGGGSGARARALLARLMGGGSGRAAPTAPPDVPSAFDPADPSGARARHLLAFVQSVSPAEAVEAFHATAPPDAVDAARSVAAALAAGGSSALPRAGFAVSITARDEACMADLLFSSVMSGYLLKNAAARLELDRLLTPPAAALTTAATAPLLPGGSVPGPEPIPASTAAPPLTPADVAAALAAGAAAAGFAPGVQTGGVSGSVTKWHDEVGPVRLDAAAYISALESQLEATRLKLAGAGAGWPAAVGGGGDGAWPLAAAFGRRAAPSPAPATGNALLGLLRTADAATLAGLTSSASPGVLEAANTFCGRLLGSSGGGKKPARRKFAAGELASLVLLSLIVGWSLRSLEARFDLDAAMA